MPDHPTHEAHRKLRNQYAAAIEKAKLEHWMEWLEHITEQSIWDAHKMVTKPSTDGSQQRVPTLQNHTDIGEADDIRDNEGKSKAFFDVFFPIQAAQEKIPVTSYPAPLFDYKPITDQKIHRAIKKLALYKAPGPDGIPNAIFTNNAGLLVPYLGPLFRATFTMQYYPSNWKVYTTIVLRKPNKPDYTIPKAYRGIALLNNISKILSACVAEDLSFWTEKLQLLPKGHFGARPGRMTIDAIHAIVDFIKNAWRRGKVVAGLFLDIQGTFPSVVIEVLVHDLRKRGIPKKYTDWLSTKLTGRKTIICFDNFESQPHRIKNGLDQGCPLSPLLYQYYNADLLDAANEKEKERAFGFIDNVCYLAEEENLDKGFKKVGKIMTKQGGVIEWMTGHHSKTAIDKTATMGFTRQLEDDPERPGKRRPIPRPDLNIQGTIIKPSKTTKQLGFILDQQLRFNEHAALALAKGMIWAMQIRRLTKPASGMPPKYARKLFITVAAPKMLYGADVSCAVKLANTEAKSGTISKLARVQRLAGLASTGALRSTPNDWLDAHVDLLPFKLLVDKICHRSVMRLASLPPSHPLYKPIRRAARLYPKYHRSPLHELTKMYRLDPDQIEQIEIVQQNPKVERKIKTMISKDNNRSPETPNATYIYTDGSGLEGAIGAAAVMKRPNKVEQTRHYHLGAATHHTVYEGEAVGLLLTLQLVKEYKVDGKVIIRTDNEAVIRALNLRKPMAGHYLLDEFHNTISELKSSTHHPNLQLEVQWIKAHDGHEGNEKADVEAKKAAQGQCSRNKNLLQILHKTLPYSTAALKQAQHAHLKERSVRNIKKSPRYHRMREIDPTTPSPTFRKISNTLNRKAASLLIQLCTGHVPLQQYLHRIGKAESPTCPFCNEGRESVYHYFIVCPTFGKQRKELEHHLGRGAKSLRNLLSNKKAIRRLLEYVNNTRRFHNIYGSISGKEDSNTREAKKGEG